MELIDNLNKTFSQDLQAEIKKGSKISIAAACFSIYAYQELKEQLQNVDELRFIFTAPTFAAADKLHKEKREFYIPKLNRERSLYGTEFEVKLRNELSQKAIAKECAEWIKTKVRFKTNITNENMTGFINVDTVNYFPVRGFTTVDLGCDRGDNAYNFVQKNSQPYSKQFLDLFENFWNSKDKLQDVTDEVVESISAAYNENSPEFIYYVTLYNIFHEFLEDISEDVLPNEGTGFKNSKIWNKLYNFQKDAVLGIINKLEKFNGCILADSVGLGKTFTALAVIKYYESRNKTVLVLCPKKLMENWNTYKDNYVNNPVAADRLNYDVLFHTDLGRGDGMSNGLDLARINWGNYDLVVIDESHNFRNGGLDYSHDDEEENEGTGKKRFHAEHKDNRYDFLMKRIIRSGVKTKVLMLSATPVNNRFWDLRNQLQLAYEGHSEDIQDKVGIDLSLDMVFSKAQRAFKKWSNLAPCERTARCLLAKLDMDFFQVLDAVTIARSRKHIEKYYDTKDIGQFPNRLPPVNLYSKLSDLKNVIRFEEIFEELMSLNLQIYTPTKYIKASCQAKYSELYRDEHINRGFTQEARELGLQKLMAINMLKRLESSVYAFDLTLKRLKNIIDGTLDKIARFEYEKKHHNPKGMSVDVFAAALETDLDEDATEYTFGSKVKIDLTDMDYISWQQALEADRDVLGILISMIDEVTPEHDSKLNSLKQTISDKITQPFNLGNKKVLIFTAFADTAKYLYDNLSQYILEKHGLHTAIVSGNVDGDSTVKGLKCSYNNVLTCFSPISKDKYLLLPDVEENIDILIGTDCISEGQNLQDCDCVINYDIHWNPVRIIQRFGRIDRIGSKNKDIKLINFWPDIELNEYLKLQARVENRLKIVNIGGAGTGAIVGSGDDVELQYRLAQLERLQREVVDMEEMSSGVSIVDLGLNEFRLDLVEYAKNHDNLEKVPHGLSAVAAAEDGAPAGVIYILKNLKQDVNIDHQNQIHPFYMVYIGMNGKVIADHLHPKDLLDKMRHLCRGKSEPIRELYSAFNKETKDGRKMDVYSGLLHEVIASIIDVKSQSDMAAFINGSDDIDFLTGEIKGLDDFELISFLVVR